MDVTERPARSILVAESSSVSDECKKTSRPQVLKMKSAQQGKTTPRHPVRPILVVLVLLHACAERGRAPSLVTDELEVSEAFHDFGKVPHGATPTHLFFLRNKSKKRIVLNKQRSSCSCADVDLRVLDESGQATERKIYDPPKRQGSGEDMVTWLEPGEKLEIQVKVLSGTRSPRARRENAYTELLFAALDKGRVEIGYEFQIQPRLIIEPGHLIQLGSFTKTQDVREGIELSPLPGKPPFKILRIEGLSKKLTLEPIPAAKKNGHRYALKVGPLGKVEPNFVRKIRFHTDIDNGYVMPVTIAGSCIPTLSFDQAKGVHFGRFDFTEKTYRFLESYYGGKLADPEVKVALESVTDNEKRDVSSYFSIRHEKKSKSEYLTTILYKGGLDARSFRGTLLVTSKEPEHRETRIEITGYNKGPL